jgi:hypothetical protein
LTIESRDAQWRALLAPLLAATSAWDAAWARYEARDATPAEREGRAVLEPEQALLKAALALRDALKEPTP